MSEGKPRRSRVAQVAALGVAVALLGVSLGVARSQDTGGDKAAGSGKKVHAHGMKTSKAHKGGKKSKKGSGSSTTTPPPK